MGVRTVIDRVATVVAEISELARYHVLIGIPAETAGRRDVAMTNAALGYIHETGLPEKNIPARPFLIPGVRSVRAATAAALRQGAVDALAGKQGAAAKAMAKAGIIGQIAVQKKITDGPFTPLSARTLRERASRGSKARREGARQALATLAAGGQPPADLARPLIDTGQLRQSIKYVVRRK